MFATSWIIYERMYRSTGKKWVPRIPPFKVIGTDMDHWHSVSRLHTALCSN